MASDVKLACRGHCRGFRNMFAAFLLRAAIPTKVGRRGVSGRGRVGGRRKKVIKVRSWRLGLRSFTIG